MSDPVYNMQMGAAEISALFKEYTGSYIMTFAGYNAGRGRVQNGWRSTAIRAIPRSMLSIGWSASHWPRRATTCSVSWKTYRCTARASATALRRPSPICIERRRSRGAPSQPQLWNLFPADGRPYGRSRYMSGATLWRACGLQTKSLAWFQFCPHVTFSWAGRNARAAGSAMARNSRKETVLEDHHTRFSNIGRL